MAVTSQSAGRKAPAAGFRLDGAGLAWLLLCVASAIPLFWSGLVSLGQAWSTPEYSHGPIIPVLSFYMFLRETRAVPPPGAPVRDRWPGVAVIAGALGLAALGNILGIDDIVTYALILWIAGLILTGFGFARGILFWASVVHLVFMLPLPNFIYWKLTTHLQLYSSEIGVWFVQLAGIPVYLEGNIIDLGVYKLQVAEACSGLRYLFPILSFSYVFSILYRGPLWHKLVLLVSAAPITVLMNAVRIGLIGVAVDRYGIGAAEGVLHFFEGWAVFLTCVAILFGMAMLMQRTTANPRPLGEAIDMDFSGLGGQIRRVLGVPVSAALVAATLTTAGLTAVWTFTPARASIEAPRDPFGLYPRTIGDWSGSTTLLDPGIEQVLGADDYLAAFFSNPAEAAPVDFFVAFYARQNEGGGVHTPEVCLPAGGWEVSRFAPLRITLPDTGFGSFEVNRAVIQKGLEKQVVYYWFEGRGRRVTNDFVAKFHTLADGLATGRTDGGIVRVITPIAPGEDATDADARLQRFLTETIDRLPRFMPQ